MILRGLKKLTDNLTALVTVADDGGGSGVLREDLGMLPPGDIRNCILALANEEPVLQELFQYRFSDGRLAGQSFGNLMIAAMLGISGSFEEAVKRVSDIFAITGEVFPVTNTDTVLRAQLEDGEIVEGESMIPVVAASKKQAIKHIWALPDSAECSEAAIQKVQSADIIILGPGSLFTSVIPPLLVNNLVGAINSSSAKIFYVSNLMTQNGETDGFSPYDHLDAILKHTKIEHIDSILVNNVLLRGAEVERYKEKHSVQSILSANEVDKILRMGVELLQGNFLKVQKGYVVHDADAICDVIIANYERRYGGTRRRNIFGTSSAI